MIVIVLILTLMFSGIAYAGETTTVGEGVIKDSTVTVMPMTTAITLSNVDINRVVCPYTIKDVVFSKEKGLSVKIEGRNAFVKFLMKKDPVSDKYIPSDTPTELYVVCGDDVYNIIAIPKSVPAKTVFLSTGKKEKIQKNQEMYRGMAYEEKIVDIVRKVYTDRIPSSFDVIKKNEKVQPVYEGLEITEIREVVIEGEGIRVKEYLLKNTGQTEMTLKEEDFLRPEITSNALAISIDNLILAQGETGRMIILEDKGAEE